MGRNYAKYSTLANFPSFIPMHFPVKFTSVLRGMTRLKPVYAGEGALSRALTEKGEESNNLKLVLQLIAIRASAFLFEILKIG